MSLLAVENLSRAFGGIQAVADLTLPQIKFFISLKLRILATKIKEGISNGVHLEL